VTRRLPLIRPFQALGLLGIVAVAACGSQDQSESKPWLRTYPARQPTLCTLSLAVEPVVGTFNGDVLADGDKSWLVAADGNRLYVVWPQGFTLSFQPGPLLRNDGGKVVAQKDTLVSLEQVNRFDHSGSMDDPYIAMGSLFDRCYVRAF
jgi:hypothetical protein